MLVYNVCLATRTSRDDAHAEDAVDVAEEGRASEREGGRRRKRRSRSLVGVRTRVHRPSARERRESAGELRCGAVRSSCVRHSVPSPSQVSVSVSVFNSLLSMAEGRTRTDVSRFIDRDDPSAQLIMRKKVMTENGKCIFRGVVEEGGKC